MTFKEALRIRREKIAAMSPRRRRLQKAANILFGCSVALFLAVVALVASLPDPHKPSAAAPATALAVQQPVAPVQDAGSGTNNDPVVALFRLARHMDEPFILPCATGDNACDRLQGELDVAYVSALAGSAKTQIRIAQLLAPGSDNPGIKPDPIEACAWAVVGRSAAPPGFTDRVCLTDANVETLHAATARVRQLKTMIALLAAASAAPSPR